MKYLFNFVVQNYCSTYFYYMALLKESQRLFLKLCKKDKLLGSFFQCRENLRQSSATKFVILTI